MTISPEFLRKARTIQSWITLIGINLAAGVCAWMSISQNRRTWILVVPAVLVGAWIDLRYIQRLIFGKASKVSGMGILRGCGFILAIVWLLADFRWWELPLVIFAGLLLVWQIHRDRISRAVFRPDIE